jgi:serine/threonine-protein kinase
MSIVYLATTGAVDNYESSLDELVVLKVANVETQHHRFCRDTLENEVNHLCKLRHPGIVQLHRIRGHKLPPNLIYSAQTDLPGKPWFSVMEYLAGGSLADLLRQQRRLDPPQALCIAQKLGETLDYIHKHGHVHLDIKPENVVFRGPLNDAVEPVLVDFGIAREIGQEGLEAGTLQWSPPERVASVQEDGYVIGDIAKPHPAMDVYALGLLLYRMVAGRLPFAGSRKRIRSAILRGAPAAPSNYETTLSPGLDRLILATLAHDPAVRPSAAEFASRVQTLRDQFPTPSFSAVVPSPIVALPPRPARLLALTAPDTFSGQSDSYLDNEAGP